MEHLHENIAHHNEQSSLKHLLWSSYNIFSYLETNQICQRNLFFVSITSYNGFSKVDKLLNFISIMKCR